MERNSVFILKAHLGDDAFVVPPIGVVDHPGHPLDLGFGVVAFALHDLAVLERFPVWDLIERHLAYVDRR